MTKQGECNSLKVVYGNDSNHLADRLSEELFSSSHPFENRLVVVPHICVKDFLFHRFISNPRLNVAAGVQILPLNQAVMEILDRVSSPVNRKRIPSFLELSLIIEEKLHGLSFEKFENLLKYLEAGDKEKKRLRIAHLSDELARLFTRYGLYGQKFLPQWLSALGWQQALWREIFSADTSWTYPLQALNEVALKPLQGKIALFGFTHIPQVHLSFFSSLSASLYHLSPCALFWEDHTSDKERLRIGRALERKGMKEEVREEMDQYMQQSHPLLGNWGKLGREMLKSMHSFIVAEEEAYIEPEGENLLCALKRSLLTSEELTDLNADDSIQIHSATSKLREVEVLRDTLDTLLHKHNDAHDPILPNEILVVSPDISAYAPYIQMVFSEHPFSYAIESMPLSSVSDALQGFLQLLNLPEERFALSSVLKLLGCAAFSQKNGFALDEIQQLSKWFKQAQIRQELVGNSNSWEEGLDRLLYGLALVPDSESYFENWPIASIPHSEIELFNRFLTIFAEIKQDLAAFSQEQTPSEWCALFLRMAERYFSFDWEREPFFQELRALALSCQGLLKKIASFESIRRIVTHLAQKPAGEIASPQLQKITFTSLQQGNLKAARILWCLGMDEGVFPQLDARSSLCEMTRLNSSEYFLSKTDEDRALFLEMFLKAQDHLIFSYQRLNAEDGKQQGPSLLIDELNQYLNQHGLKSGISSLNHPAFPFDQVYFSSEFPVKKWSQADYLAAKAHYFPQSKPSAFFTKNTLEITAEQEIVIDIRQLKKLARNPLQFYLNETLKIYLKEEDDDEETEFLLTHLRKSLLRKKAVHSSLSQVVHQMRAEGKMPRGLFQEAALQELEEEMRDLLSELKEFGIQPNEIRSVRFATACLAQEKSESLLPPLSIPLSDSRVVHIVGKLEDISPKGLLYHGDDDLKSLLKAWPLYLIYRVLTPENSQLLLTKKGATVEFALPDPKAALAAYLEYALLAKQTPSPLMPEWAKSLLQGTAEDFRAALSKDPTYDDPYLSYLKRRHGLFDPIQTFDLWKDRLGKAFDSMNAVKN